MNSFAACLAAPLPRGILALLSKILSQSALDEPLPVGRLQVLLPPQRVLLAETTLIVDQLSGCRVSVDFTLPTLCRANLSRRSAVYPTYMFPSFSSHVTGLSLLVTRYSSLVTRACHWPIHSELYQDQIGVS